MQRKRVPSCGTGNREDSIGEFDVGSRNGVGVVEECRPLGMNW